MANVNAGPGDDNAGAGGMKRPGSPQASEREPKRAKDTGDAMTIHDYCKPQYAGQNRTEDLRRLVQDHGVPVDDFDAEGLTPLHHAASNGCNEAVSALLRLGANVRVERLDPRRDDPDAPWPALDIVKSKFNLRTDGSWEVPRTALDMAAANGHCEAVRLLTTREPGSKTWYNSIGAQAVHFAALNDMVNTLALLLNFSRFHRDDECENVFCNGQSHGCRDLVDLRLLVMAVAEGDSASCLPVLKAHNVDILAEYQLTDDIYRFPSHGCMQNCLLLSAASYGANRVLKVLLDDYEEDVRRKNSDGATAIHYAAGWGQTETIVLLVQKGANVDCPDSAGVSPLWYAAYTGFDCSVKTLFSLNATINKQVGRDADWSSTPLAHALRRQNHACAEMLVKCGADVNICDTSTGWTPLEYAMQRYEMGSLWYGSLQEKQLQQRLLRDDLLQLKDNVVSVVCLLVKAGARCNANLASTYQSWPLELVELIRQALTHTQDYKRLYSGVQELVTNGLGVPTVLGAMIAAYSMPSLEDWLMDYD